MPKFVDATEGDGLRFQRWAAGAALAIGLLALIGLASGVDLLIRWLPSSTTMNPVTAILLVIGGSAMLAPPRIQRLALPTAATLMIVAGALKLVQAAAGRPLGFDYWLARALFGGSGILPDLLALNTALAFILLGAALLIGRAKRPMMATAAHVLAITAIAIAVMALTGFALGAATINQLTLNRMPVNSAIALTAFGMAILTVNPRHGIMRLLLSQSPSGTLARIALPVSILAPVLLGIVRLWLQHVTSLKTEDGVAIMVAGSIALTLGILWGSLILLLRSDADLRAKAAALEVSEAQYRQAGRIGQMGHWHFDVVGQQLHWTNEFRALLGLPADLAPSFEVMDERIHPDDQIASRALMKRALAEGEDWNWQLRVVTLDGSVRHARSHGICRRAPDGSIDSILGVLADVTELESARQAAEAATVAQAAFLANMSHEIRTPLNGVLGFITLLLDSKLDSTQRRYLSLVNDSARSLLKLLNDILDLSKVEAGQLEVAPTATDLRQIVRHAVRLMAPIAEQKNITLRAKVDPAFPDSAMIDGARFRQILLNILGNALKFTDHGSVSVRLAHDQHSAGPAAVRVTVTDTGIGIPADRLDAMFKPFVQADSSTSRKYGGSGLGLSISRQLADLMGGTLTIDSIEGAGTTIELTLPLLVASASDPTGHDRQASLSASGDEEIGAVIAAARARPARSILLVEDLELNRMLVGEMLDRLGHEVDFAINGAEALDLAARLDTEPLAWDLILMDVQMPVMNGNDATRAIRALGGRAAAIPIVALSANAFENEIRESRDAGMDDHLIKPIDFALLSRTIDHWAEVGSLPGPAALRRA